MMRTSNEGKVEIVGHEGIALSKYKDSVGVWTIGIGATRSEIADLSAWPLSKTITIQEAFDLFSRSIVKYEDAINKALARPIDQYQFDALVSWCYNVGVGWVPKATIIKLVNQDASPKELYNALLMFRKPPEIIGRRIKEANLLAYGKYGENGRALLFPVSSSGYPMYTKGASINVWQYIPHTASAEPFVLIVPVAEQKAAENKPGLFSRGVNLIRNTLSMVGGIK